MSTAIDRIQRPELFFGFVSPIGTDLGPVLGAFRSYFEARSYEVVEIKVTDIFPIVSKYVQPKIQLQRNPLYERYRSYIAYGNQLRHHFKDDAILATSAIARIVRARNKLPRDNDKDRFSRTVFLVHQFKRKEEIDIFRSVYGRLFFQISIYSRRGARVDHLSRRFASSANEIGAQRYRNLSEEIVQDDENQVEDAHGQRITKIFHDADFIVSSDVLSTVDAQVSRFCELLMGSNCISPTKDEYGVFLAKAAALRTLDLSRQVGAAIFTEGGEVISLGSNEVPKASGGSYWSDESFDDREYKRSHDSNDQRKYEILGELLKLIDDKRDPKKLIADKKVRDSQFMDALEYGRIVHAEMSALTDAARLGRGVKGATLYCTTFPCHMCAKHIVAAGLNRVVFLEPYPKSLASDLHSDSLQIEGADRGKYQSFPYVEFEHFFGVSPRRYRELFERGKRKNDVGEFEPYLDGVERPIIDLKFPFYTALEGHVTGILIDQYEAHAGGADVGEA